MMKRTTNGTFQKQKFDLCLICNPEARAQLDERVRRFMEDLVADRPATAIHGIVCLFWQWVDWR